MEYTEKKIQLHALAGSDIHNCLKEALEACVIEKVDITLIYNDHEYKFIYADLLSSARCD